MTHKSCGTVKLDNFTQLELCVYGVEVSKSDIVKLRPTQSQKLCEKTK
jgi:hypothetical protein